MVQLGDAATGCPASCRAASSSARRAGAGYRLPAEDPADGRAARRARPQAARRHADRDQAAAPQLGTTILYVTHDQDRRRDVRPHRRAATAAPRAVRRADASSIPARVSEFVAGFVGETHSLPPRRCNRTIALSIARIRRSRLLRAAVLAPASRVTVSLRPEHIVVSPPAATGGVPARVEEVLFLGDTVICVVGLEGARS